MSARDDLLAAVRLHVAELTPRQRMLAVAAAGGVAEISGALPAVARAIGAEAAQRLAAVTRDDAEAELARAQRRGARVVRRGDAGWPPLLSEIADPPWALWVRGDLPDPDRVAVALVGPRRPSPYGLTVARDLARRLAEAGVVIVSGGARGVDGCAHAAALAAGAPTVAVLGCGVDVTYPPDHRALFDRIEQAGAIVSEHPCGVEPRPHHFPVRNRLLAGWCRAVVVPEAAPESGSLITARLALEAGRDVMAVPGPITSRLSEGPNALIADGARLVRGVGDVLAELGVATVAAAAARDGGGVPASPAAPADPVLACLPAGLALSLDELVERTGRPPAALLASLGGLEALGLVQALPGGLWLRLGAS